MIVLDGDAVAADRINLSGRCMDRSGQLRGRCTFRGRASGNVDRCARFTEAKRDALADASAGAGYECNLTFKWSRYTSFVKLLNPILTIPPCPHAAVNGGSCASRSVTCNFDRRLIDGWRSVPNPVHGAIPLVRTCWKILTAISFASYSDPMQTNRPWLASRIRTGCTRDNRHAGFIYNTNERSEVLLGCTRNALCRHPYRHTDRALAYVFQMGLTGDSVFHARFALTPISSTAHVLGGGTLLILGGFQFVSALRGTGPTSTGGWAALI